MNRTVFTLLVASFVWITALADSEIITDLEQKLDKVTGTEKVAVLLELTREYEYSDIDKANHYADLAVELGQEIGYLPGVIRSYMNISFLRQIVGNTEEGMDYLNKAISLSEETGNKALLNQAYGRLGGMHFTRGEFGEAEKYAQLSLDIAEELDSMQLKLTAYQLFGMINGTQGNYKEALEYFFKLLDYHTANEDELNMSTFYKNIGQTYRRIEKYDEAIEYLNKAYEIQHRLGNIQQEAWVLSNLGACYSKKGEHEKALEKYELSLELAKKVGNLLMIINGLDQIGQNYISQSKFTEAEQYLLRAYQESEKHGKNSHAVYITGSLAEVYLELDRIPESITFSLQQLDMAREENVVQQILAATGRLATLYARNNDFQLAFRYQEELIAVKDSLYNIDKSEQIEEITAKYETEKKEQEIENLTALNETARYRNISYAGAAISFLILGGLLYYVQRLRTRRNRILLEKEKELDRLKSRFFANISHEFRTPLTLILGPLDDMIAAIEQADFKKQLKVMQRNAGRLLDLVNQLLDLSKIESGKLQLNNSSSDIISVIKGVSMSFHSIAEQKNIELALDISPESLVMDYDREKLETILSNLLSNAFKFTPEYGRISIQSRIIEEDTDRKMLKVRVSDNGKGIPQDEIDQIFNRFYQSDTNQLSQHEGSGIGLALTKELIELHEGKITAQSKIGEGTKITFELPVHVSVTDVATGGVGFSNEKALKNHELDIDVEENSLSGTNDLPVVLVIEDHEDVRNYVRDTLGKNFSIVSANDGEEGISKAIEHIPDLIVSDVMMPKKDGFEVCQTLKQDEKTSHIPIILLTAKSDSEDKISGLMTKADDYVTKPFVPRELLVRIENLIESRKQLREKYKKEGVIRPKDVTVNSIDEKFLEKLIALVEINMVDEKFGVEQLGEELGMSRSQLHRKLKALLDQGPNQFIRSFRLQRAHDLLKQKTATASEIAYQVGFSSPSYFTKCFHEQFGYTPSEVPD